MGKIWDDIKSYWTVEPEKNLIFETGKLFVPAEKWESVGEAFGILNGGYQAKNPVEDDAYFNVQGQIDIVKDGILVEWTLEGGNEDLSEKLLGYLNKVVDRANSEPGREVTWVSRGSSRKLNVP